MQECEFESHGLKVIQENFESSSKLCSIIDFGTAKQEILNLVSKQHVIYTVVNLFSKYANLSEIINQGAENEELCSTREIADALNLHLRHPPDLILTWDYFNYLPRPLIVQLMGYFSEICVRGTLLHSISWVHGTMPRSLSKCTFIGQDRFRIQFEDEAVKSPSYSAQKLKTIMPSFNIDRVSMYNIGLVEIVMRYEEFRDPPSINLVI